MKACIAGLVLLLLGGCATDGAPPWLALPGATASCAKPDASQELSLNMADDMLAEGERLFRMAEQDPVDKLPAEFIMLARVFTTLGGLFVHYKPDMDVNRYLLPHLIGPAFQAVR